MLGFIQLCWSRAEDNTVEYQIICNIKFSHFIQERKNLQNLHIMNMNVENSPLSNDAKIKFIASVIVKKMHLNLKRFEFFILILWTAKVGNKATIVLYNLSAWSTDGEHTWVYHTSGEHISK